MLGLEARSSRPHHQHDGGNLPGQGQTRHLRSEALGQQSGVELLKRAGFARGHDRRTLKQILQIVIAVAVQSANSAQFLDSLQLPVDTTVIRQGSVPFESTLANDFSCYSKTPASRLRAGVASTH